MSNSNPGSAPALGQKWNLNEFIKGGVEFTTLIGTFVWDSEPGHQRQQPPVPPPWLANLSLHFWHVGDTTKYPDLQTPHKQDEAYYVISGSGSVTIEGKEQSLSNGDLVFVPRCAEHTFHVGPHDAGLDLLVIFGPNFTG